ncbi:MAG TPA: M36 family metallopeptidase, partial [Pyrinomonadaceae bacterium]
QINLTDGAFAPAFPGSATAVHDGGEIWSSMLWEVRSLLVARLGHEAGTAKMLQLQLDGMKLVGSSPTMLSERNAIIAGALAGPDPGPDVADVREGFRRRGMGFSAANPSGNTVVEAFDFPNVQVTNPFTVSDAPGDNDGFPEPSEDLVLNISVTNPGAGSTITNVQVNVNGGSNVSFGDIANGATVTMPVPYTVPGDAVCGSLHQVTINVSSTVGAQTPVMRTFRLGAPIGGAPISFSNTTPITIPSSGPGVPYPSTISVSGVTGNKAIKVELTDISHTFPDDVDFLLEGPNGQNLIILSDAGGTNDWVAADITLTDLAENSASDAGANPTGEYKPTNYGANDPFDPPAPASPYGNPAPAGTDTFESKFGTNGANMNGDWKLYLDDDLAGFSGSVAGGWKITFESNEYVCNVAPTAVRSRADFDGDGKTDLSVFRPSEGNWYLNRSMAGFAVINWGISTDTLVPGDYDADGKTDTAIFRASADPGVADFYILNSNGFTVQGVSWGILGDIPVVADYDGDGKADAAVYRPSTNTWYVLNSGNGSNYIEPFGIPGDVPMAMDTNADGKAQIAMFRGSNNTWYIARPTGTPATNFDSIPFGAAGDFKVPADYDGDNKDDVAVYRPSNGTWYVLRSTDGVTSSTAFGVSTDVPAPGDYDGDGRDDQAVYRNGTWYVLRSTSGLLIQPFGIGSDKPIPSAYIP